MARRYLRWIVIAVSLVAGYGVAAGGWAAYQRYSGGASTPSVLLARDVERAESRYRHILVESAGYESWVKPYRCPTGDGEIVVKGKDKEVRHLIRKDVRTADGCVTVREFFRWERKPVYYSSSHDCSTEETQGGRREERVWFHDGRAIRRVEMPEARETTGKEVEVALVADYARSLHLAETGLCEDSLTITKSAPMPAQTAVPQAPDAGTQGP